MSNADVHGSHDLDGPEEGSVGAGGATADGAIDEALGTDQPLTSNEGSVGAGGASADGARSE